MKKNLMTVIILALLIVNLAMTGIMMFSVTSTAKKTASVIDQIAAVLNLELEPVTDDAEPAAPQVAIEDTEFRDLTDKMTIRLTPAEGEEDPHYVIVEGTLLLNKKSKDYKKLAETLSTSAIQSIFYEKLGAYTYDGLIGHEDKARAEILKEIQTMFNSDMIFDVKFKSIMMQ